MCRPDRLGLVLHGTISPGWVPGSVVGFVVPFLFADVLQLPRDLYYGVYIAAVLVFFVLWARTTGQRLDVMVRRRWRLAVVLGLVIAARPRFRRRAHRARQPAALEGLALAWAVLWRGVAYGAADGLLLSAFPILAVFAAAEDSEHCAGAGPSTLAVGAVALLASMVMTTVYHLGYPDFRSPMLVRPVAADFVWSVPTLVTLNPIGARSRMPACT